MGQSTSQHGASPKDGGGSGVRACPSLTRLPAMVWPGPSRGRLGTGATPPAPQGSLAEQTGPPGLSVSVAGQSGHQEGSEAAATPKEKVKQEQDELTCNLVPVAWRVPGTHTSTASCVAPHAGVGTAQGAWGALRLTFACSGVTTMAQGGPPGTPHRVARGCVPTIPRDRDATDKED